jgi:hypothetical protein
MPILFIWGGVNGNFGGKFQRRLKDFLNINLLYIFKIYIFKIDCSLRDIHFFFLILPKINFAWLRDYYTHDIFHIGPGISPRLPYQARQLIWVEGWYQEPYGKFHVIIFLSHILHWPFPSIDFYIAKKIYEQTNCENKSLIELPLFNLQIFLFRIWFQKYTKQCRSVQWR